MFNANVEYVNFDKEAKRRHRKEQLSQAWDEFRDFVRDNQDVLVFTVPAAVTILGGGSKLLSKAIAHHTSAKEIRFKERTIYDRSLGRYVQLKRPLKAREALEIERRRRAGERLNSILNDMRLIK